MKTAFGILVLTTGLVLVLGAPEGRINNAKIAGDHQFPFMAVMHTLWFDDICGATILNQRWVLSSARCAKLTQYTALVSVGINKLEDKHLLVTSVDKVVVHPDFDLMKFSNDIALFHLTGELQYSESVQPVTLADEHVEPDTQLVIVGWGATVQNARPSNDLRFKNISTIDTAECNEEFPDYKFDDDKQTCAYGTKGGGGGCKGDLGDPALLPSGEQVGILSFGGNCGEGKPDVQTRIKPYLAWIKETIGS